jgi:hypothetical protein
MPVGDQPPSKPYESSASIFEDSMNPSLHSDDTRIGASFIAKRTQANPREIIVRLVEENPAASKDVLFLKFREELRDDEDQQRAVEWYFFVNMHSYLATSRNAHRGMPLRSTKHRNRVSAIKQQVLSLSLDFVMPNGKALRDCTGTYCERTGGMVAKIGKHVGRRKVGAVIVDDVALQKVLK